MSLHQNHAKNRNKHSCTNSIICIYSSGWLKKSKNINDVLKALREYNAEHGTRLSYGQYVSLMEFESKKTKRGKNNGNGAT